MNPMTRCWMAFLISFSMVWTQSLLAAENSYSLGTDDYQKPLPTAQYIYSLSGRSNLITVELLGAVSKPGLYYVPSQTDLTKLLSLAGGTLRGADVNHILVRKTNRSDWKSLGHKGIEANKGSFEIDIETLIESGKSNELTLTANDFVYVPQDEPMVSDDLFRTASVVSLVIGSVLTAVLIADRANQK